MTAFAKPRGLPDQRHKCDWLLDLKVCVGGGGRGHGLLGGRGHGLFGGGGGMACLGGGRGHGLLGEGQGAWPVGGGRGHGLLGGGAWPVGGGIPEAIGDGWVTYLVVQGCHNTVGCPHGVRGQLSHCSLQHGCNNMCSAV
jgi:hypothetical protein